jgi:hypothetical protein
VELICSLVCLSRVSHAESCPFITGQAERMAERIVRRTLRSKSRSVCRCEPGTVAVQRRLFSKLHRFREHAINAAAQENRRDRIDVRRDVFQSFRAKLAALKTAPTCGASLSCSGFPARLLAAFEWLQGSTDASDDVIPGALFACGVLEIKTVDRVLRPARKIATTIVDHAFMHR